ncbi:ACP phosphodiesterase [Anaerophaga thermohalophila]|uniref:acyl carrier protein phosphodiesterase n=1 Tax=Anaerophaga thermohalophila TaxID=177400 RepID=UPI00037DE8D1|nr:ACP phosphodiesterase [Anaerophaga thermohalophila]
MNYLAHLYLSGDDAKLLVGNFIGDYVKGRRFTRYSGVMQTGILLHRHIDSFTDNHPVFQQSSSVFRDGYRRYAGVVCDIIYDHFLAANWRVYSEVDLHSFVVRAHRILMQHYFSLPSKVKQFLPFLIKSRRLENYQHIEGVEKTLNIMSANSSLPDKTSFALKQLQSHYDELQQQFSEFMPEIKASVRAFMVAPDRFISFNHPAIS